MKPTITYLIKYISLTLVVGLVTLNSTVPQVACKCNKKDCTAKKVVVQKITIKTAPVPFSFYNDVVAPLFPALKI
jgi:hypothetical protein